MKKLLSLVMVFALSISMVLPVNGAGVISSETNKWSVVELDNGKVYSQTSDEKNVVILTDEVEGLASMAITYTDEPGKVYQWWIHDLTAEDFSSPRFSADAVAYAKAHHSDATVVTVSVTKQSGIEVTDVDAYLSAPQTRSDLGNNLIGEMREIHGATYSRFPRYNTVYNGQEIYVRENLVYRVDADIYTVQNGITVAGLLLAIGGLVTPMSVAKICSIFGLGTSVASAVIPTRGEIRKYVCSAIYTRYTTINGSEYAYSFADKIVSYDAYDDGDDYSEEPSELLRDTVSVYYPQGEAYYNSYADLVADGYEMFEYIGQQP